MGIISWIVFGALAGWVANMAFGKNQKSGCLTNTLIGVIGAFVGGLIMNFINGRPYRFSFDLHSFGVAILGAVLLLAITGSTRK